MSAPDNPLSGIDDTTLWNTQLLLSILCNRRPFNMRKPRSAALCRLGESLKLEADLRGLPSPDHPYNIGKWRDVA